MPPTTKTSGAVGPSWKGGLTIIYIYIYIIWNLTEGGLLLRFCDVFFPGNDQDFAACFN